MVDSSDKTGAEAASEPVARAESQATSAATSTAEDRLTASEWMTRFFWTTAVLAVALVVGVMLYARYQDNLPEKRIARAMAAYEAGEIQNVEAEAAALLQTDGYVGHGHLLAGMAHNKLGRLKQALDQFELAVEYEEVAAQAHVGAAEVYFKRNLWPKAIERAEAALEIDENSVDAHRWLGKVYLELGAMTAVLPHLDRIAELDPTDPKPHRLKGAILKDYERWTEAVDAYLEALRLDKKNPTLDDGEVRLELVEALVILHRYEEAMSNMPTLPLSANRMWLEASCQYALGEISEAKQLVADALDRDENHRPTLLLKSEMLLDENRVPEAVQILQALSAAHPYDHEIHLAFSQALRRDGQIERADQELAESQRLTELRKRFAELHQMALVDLESPDLRVELASLAMQVGKPDLATGWVRAALALDPDHELALEMAKALAQQPLVPTTP